MFKIARLNDPVEYDQFTEGKNTWETTKNINFLAKLKPSYILREMSVSKTFCENSDRQNLELTYQVFFKKKFAEFEIDVNSININASL